MNTKKLFLKNYLLKPTSLYIIILFLSGCSGFKTINTAEELQNLHNEPAGKFKLTTDITVDNWQPMKGFNGILDGNGHTITIKSINNAISVTDGIVRTGLFAEIGKDGIVRNLRIDGNLSYEGTCTECWAGGITAQNQGLIQNCASKATITAQGGSKINSSGSIAAENNGGSIVNCYSTGALNAKGEGNAHAVSGGITGYNAGTISTSFSAGMVIAKGGEGNSQAGGIVGNNKSGSINNCVAMNVAVRASGKGENSNGRITGVNSAESLNNYALSTIRMIEKGFGKEESNQINMNLLQDQDWWKNNVKFNFGTSQEAPWEWSTVNVMPVLCNWEDAGFEVGKVKSAGASGLTFFDEPQKYSGIINFEKSKNVELSIILSADATQITEIKLSADDLYLTPKNFNKNRSKDQSKKSSLKYTDDSYSSANFLIENIGGYNAPARDSSGNFVVGSMNFKGGLINTDLIEIVNDKISSELGLIFDFSITDACIYGNIKVEMSGCGTPSVYAILKNATTPQEIPSGIMNP